MSRRRSQWDRGPQRRDTTTEATLPPRVVDAISEAGASVMRWYEDGALAITDPHRVWQRAGQISVWAAMVAVVALAGFAAHPVAAGLVVVLVLAGGAFRAKVAFLPAWASAVAVVLVAVPWGHAPLGAVVVPLVCVLVAWLLSATRTRNLSMGAMLAGTALTRLGIPAIGVWAVLVGVLLAVFADTTVNRSWPWERWAPARDALNARYVPPGPFQSPWLTRVGALRPGQLRRMPDEVARRRAGAVGERRTALILLGLRRGRGTRIVNDVTIPGAKDANADHMVVSRTGRWVIDSKQYGTAADPGLVCIDRSGRLVHVTRDRRRDITGSVQVLAWACSAIGALVNASPTADGFPRGILAIHGASVDPDITLQGTNGVLIDVVSARDLTDRIDGAPTLLSRRECVAAANRMRLLKSASTGTSPRLVSPMGSRGGTFRSWPTTRTAPVPFTTRNPDARPTTPGPSRPDAPSRDRYDQAPQGVDRRDRPARGGTGGADVTQVLPQQHPAPDRDVAAGEDAGAAAAPPGEPEWQDMDPPTPPPVARTNGDPLYDPMINTVDVTREQWLRMNGAPTPAQDDVPVEFRGVGRGTRMKHIKFDDHSQDVFVQDVVALRGVCVGNQGPYAWVCSPQQWDSFQATGRPVRPVTVPVANLMIDGDGVTR